MDWIRSKTRLSTSKLSFSRLTLSNTHEETLDRRDSYPPDAASAFSISNPAVRATKELLTQGIVQEMFISDIHKIMRVPSYFEPRSNGYVVPSLHLEYGSVKLGLIFDEDTSIFEKNHTFPTFCQLTPPDSRVFVKPSFQKETAYVSDKDLAWYAFINSPVIQVKIVPLDKDTYLTDTFVKFKASFPKAELVGAFDYYKHSCSAVDLKVIMDMFDGLNTEVISINMISSTSIRDDCKQAMVTPDFSTLARVCLYYHDVISYTYNDS